MSPHVPHLPAACYSLTFPDPTYPFLMPWISWASSQHRFGSCGGGRSFAEWSKTTAATPSRTPTSDCDRQSTARRESFVCILAVVLSSSGSPRNDLMTSGHPRSVPFTRPLCAALVLSLTAVVELALAETCLERACNQGESGALPTFRTFLGNTQCVFHS